MNLVSDDIFKNRIRDIIDFFIRFSVGKSRKILVISNITALEEEQSKYSILFIKIYKSLCSFLGFHDYLK